MNTFKSLTKFIYIALVSSHHEGGLVRVPGDTLLFLTEANFDIASQEKRVGSLDSKEKENLELHVKRRRFGPLILVDDLEGEFGNRCQ